MGWGKIESGTTDIKERRGMKPVVIGSVDTKLTATTRGRGFIMRTFLPFIADKTVSRVYTVTPIVTEDQVPGSGQRKVYLNERKVTIIQDGKRVGRRRDVRRAQSEA